MNLQAWEKKTVTLEWGGLKLPFRVAQELFSSHEIDQGTKLLLRSLDLTALPDPPVVLDFGCGYGPLGLALKARVPAARVVLIDRDALAVEFATWNARALDLAQGKDDVVAHGGLDLGSPLAPDGYDLILWNVPGKAGESVLRALLADVPHALRPGGLLALVIVNPLAAVLRDAVTSHPSLSATHDERHTAHTVMHVRQGSSGQRGWPLLPAFRRGVFDRRAVERAWRGEPYTLLPVIGLPEYDGPDFTSLLLMEALLALAAEGRRADHLMMQGVGQGHAAILATRLLGPRRVTLFDHDLLALEATKRSLSANGDSPQGIYTCHTPLIEGCQMEDNGADAVIWRLDSQLSPPVVTAQHDRLRSLLNPDGAVLVGGPSTSVSRFLAVAGKRGYYKLRGRTRRSGASVAGLELR